jgi:hypothetical protein
VEAGLAGEGFEFRAAEAGGDGGGGVVAGHAVPAEKAAGCGDESEGDGVAFEVDTDDGAAADGPEVGEELDDLGVREVMEEEGGKDDVDGIWGKRESKGVGGDGGEAVAGEVMGAEVEADDAGVGVGVAEGFAHVAGGGADVEKRERSGGRQGRQATEGLLKDAVSAEPEVEPTDVGEGAGGFPGIGAIHEFGDHGADLEPIRGKQRGHLVDMVRELLKRIIV